MLGIWSKTFMIASRQKPGERHRWDAPQRWVKEDLPFLNAGAMQRTRDD